MAINYCHDYWLLVSIINYGQWLLVIGYFKVEFLRISRFKILFLSFKDGLSKIKYLGLSFEVLKSNF